MAELRAEYAQGILDDARRDPVLAHLLDQTEAALDDQLFGTGRPKELLLIRLTSYANGFVDALSEPGRQANAHYQDYSSDMIMVAALCQLHDRYSRAGSRT